jgi:hypothetical protein
LGFRGKAPYSHSQTYGTVWTPGFLAICSPGREYCGVVQNSGLHACRFPGMDSRFIASWARHPKRRFRPGRPRA